MVIDNLRNMTIGIAVMDVTFGNQANALIASTVMRLTPYETGEGSIVWRCGAAPALAVV